MRIIITSLLFLLISLSGMPSYSGEMDPVKGNLVIFTFPQQNIELNAIVNESAAAISETCSRLGRFMEVEYNRKSWAAGQLTAKGTVDDYRKMAEILKVDLYVIINAQRIGRRIISEMRIVSLEDEYRKMQGLTVVKSRIGNNIPLKLAREIAYLHDKIRLKAGIARRKDDGSIIINAGQWHGIHPGSYRTANGKKVRVAKTGRYRSLVTGETAVSENSLIFNIFPDTRNVIDDLEDRLSKNALYRYSLKHTLLKGLDDEKRMINGTCVINTGANFCMPGYGSFLSVKYMGFEADKPAVYGIALSSALIGTQLLLPVSMEKFSINFFPGINDGEKKENIKDLQYFLWLTLPITFSASYFDQLAFQYQNKENLPPFSENMDAAAVTMSLFIPGGGLFYKGYRLAGWGYYITEMFLAGYGIYNRDKGHRGKYAFGIFGVIKIIELFNAYLVKPGYGFYNLEMENGIKRIGMLMDIKQGYDGEGIYTAAIAYRF